MQNFIKTIIDAVQTWTKKEIKQNTVQLIEDVDELKDSVENVASAAMSKKNPVGAGSFSMNRMPGSEIGSYSHAEGRNATASGEFSHAEGYSTEALFFGAHAEGDNTIASGKSSHAEGSNTNASGQDSHAEGSNTNAFGQDSHAEGRTSTIGIRISGKANTTTYKLKSSYINIQQGAILEYNGEKDAVQATVVSFDGRTSAIITDKTLSSNDLNNAYVYLLRGIASGEASHSEGFNTVAHGDYSHAEGNNTSTPGKSAHAEGFETVASGESSHAECHSTRAFGACSHAEGEVTTASGYGSHAEGSYTLASGNYSHVQGIYNINDVDLNGQALGKYAHIVGNGASDYYRSNAHTLDWSGVGWFQGGLQVGGTEQDGEGVGYVPFIPSAQVGQTIVVSEVDENGKPTKWEAADAPRGNDGIFTKLTSIALEEEVSEVIFDETIAPGITNCKELLVHLRFNGCESAATSGWIRLYMGNATVAMTSGLNNSWHTAVWAKVQSGLWASSNMTSDNNVAGQVINAPALDCLSPKVDNNGLVVSQYEDYETLVIRGNNLTLPIGTIIDVWGVI